MGEQVQDAADGHRSDHECGLQPECVGHHLVNGNVKVLPDVLPAHEQVLNEEDQHLGTPARIKALACGSHLTGPRAGEIQGARQAWRLESTRPRPFATQLATQLM